MSRQPKKSSIYGPTESLMNGTRKMILNSNETDGDVYLVQGIMPKGSVVPLHIHKHEDEIFHVLEGQVELILGEEMIEGNVGDIIYLPRGIKHGIKTKGEHSAKVLNYVIPGDNFERFFDELNGISAEEIASKRDAVAKKYGITFL